ncbi:hypothetical protein PBRA_007760 [Plasmodiophora brassicae]|uniref:Uncharacterized protein n=1 Tax=Plasmodiophora brassicae TaxID=37360 RepID=A0A0G4IY84_PLABS|nr:hypothetical protein PBRA_007760 [Plasmodiophora brassicae]
MASIDLVEIEMASIDEAAKAFTDLPRLALTLMTGRHLSRCCLWRPPALGMEFETQLELKNFIEGFAKSIIIKFKTFAKASRSVQLFGHEGAWARGDRYCNFKTESGKADRSVKSSCTMNISFTSYDFGRRRYVFKRDRFCLSHNHLVEVSSPATAIVNDQWDLTPEQMSYILNLGKYSLPFPMVTRMLSDQFSDCRIQKPLLHRPLRKGKLQAFGGDRDAMDSLVKMGRSHEEHDGFRCAAVAVTRQLIRDVHASGNDTDTAG